MHCEYFRKVENLVGDAAALGVEEPQPVSAGTVARSMIDVRILPGVRIRMAKWYATGGYRTGTRAVTAR
jgi:hypothetical protein